MSVSGRILRGTGWMTLAGVLARVGTFAANLIVIRLLGLELVGQWGLIESWLSLATMFALFGLATAVTRYVARYLESDVARVGEMAAAALLIAGSFSVMVAALAFGVIVLLPAQRFSGGDQGLIGATQTFLIGHPWLFMGLIIIPTLSEIGRALLQGLQAFRFFVYLNLLVGLLSVPLYVALTQVAGVAGVLTARLVLTAAEMLLALLLVGRLTRRLGARWSLHHLIANGRALLGFALPTFLGQLVANPVKTFMLSFLAAQPGGAVQVGLLTTAGRLVGLASFLPGSMATVLMPILAFAWGQKQRDHFRYSVLAALRMMWMVSLPTLLFFMAAAPALLRWLFGPEYVAASTVTIIMLGISIVNVYSDTTERTLAAANRQWLSMATTLGGMMLSIALGYQLLPAYLALGYALTFLISTIVYATVELQWLRTLFHVDLSPIRRMTAVTMPFAGIALLITSLDFYILQVLLSLSLSILIVIIIWRLFLEKSEKNALINHFDTFFSRVRSYRQRSSKTQTIG